MSYYVQSVYLVQSISIMNFSSLSLKTCVSSESVTQLSNCYCNALNRTISMIVYIHIDFLINVINVLIPIIKC